MNKLSIINSVFYISAYFLAVISMCFMFVYINKRLISPKNEEEEEEAKDEAHIIRVVKSKFKEIGNRGMFSDINIPDNVYTILLILGAVVSVAIRVYRFGEVPDGFNQDGAMAAVDANALANHGTDRYGMRFPVHLTAWGYGQMSALLSYLMVPFIKIFGFSPIVLRLPQLIVSLVGILCLYLFIKDAFGKNIGLFVFLFAAVNPWHIIQSRWALDCNLYPHFFIIGIYFLYKGIGKKKYLVLSMISFGLCMYCYGVSIYTMPIFLLLSCIYLLIMKKIKIKDAILSAVVYLLVAWPFIMVMMINFFKWDTIETPLFTLPYFQNSVRSNDILFFSDNIGKQLIENFKSLMNITFLQKHDLPWNDIEGFGTIYLFSVPFTILGIVSLCKRYMKKTGAAFIIFYFLTGIICGLFTNGVNINRINIIYYAMIILTGFGLYEVSKWFAFAKWSLPAVYILAFCVFVNAYFTTYADEIRGCFHADFGNALEAAEEEGAEKYYITVYLDSVDLTEVFLQFYHEIDSEYYQGNRDNGGLPYNEKYTICGKEGWKMDSSENAVYVVNEDEVRYFDTNIFDVQQFGIYFVVTPI